MLKDLAQNPISSSWGQADTMRLKSYESYAQELGYNLPEQILCRTGLILFLTRMPYREPPAILRRHVASLMSTQIREVSKLSAEQRRAFTRHSLPVLRHLLSFLLAGDPHVLEGALANLGTIPQN